MSIEDRKNIPPKSNIIQNLILESREKLNISGALDVLSFDDQIVILETHLGLLTVKGEDLRISKLNIDSEEVIVDGNITYIMSITATSIGEIVNVESANGVSPTESGSIVKVVASSDSSGLVTTGKLPFSILYRTGCISWSSAEPKSPNSAP